MVGFLGERQRAHRVGPKECREAVTAARDSWSRQTRRLGNSIRIQDFGAEERGVKATTINNMFSLFVIKFENTVLDWISCCEGKM